MWQLPVVYAYQYKVMLISSCWNDEINVVILCDSPINYFHFAEILWAWRWDASCSRCTVKTIYGHLCCRVSVSVIRAHNLELKIKKWECLLRNRRIMFMSMWRETNVFLKMATSIVMVHFSVNMGVFCCNTSERDMLFLMLMFSWINQSL